MTENSVFDIIIAGGGTAGCVLANRLSADPALRVLLIEAGATGSTMWFRIPVGYAKLFGDPKYNWIFKTEPEPNLGNRQGPFFQGKALGGSSAVNGMVYVRGQREDFDHWQDMGNVGWGYESVLTYYKKAEDQCRGANEFHGTEGPMAVDDPPQRHEICEAFIAAAAEAGVPANSDFNGASQEGAGYYQFNMRNGRRVSTATAYLDPVRKRRNLTILPEVEVEKILFQGQTAVGVEYVHKGVRYKCDAEKEVILSAGGIGSPLLLQRSGVGPGELLNSFGIKVTKDIPAVGRHLRNHFNPWVSYRCKRPITFNDYMRTLSGRMRLSLRYVFFRSGFMAMGPVWAGAFIRTDPHAARPDAQIHLFLFSTSRTEPKLNPFSGVMATICQLRPESEGFVEIGGPNLSDCPRVCFNYLTSDVDRRIVENGLRRLRDIMKRPALARYIGEEVDSFPDRTDNNEALTYSGEVRGTAHHLTGSCSMGIDDGSVVDPCLRVHGIKNLRVIDASIMPTPVSGNTAAPTVMLAEKGADMVLHDIY